MANSTTKHPPTNPNPTPASQDAPLATPQRQANPRRIPKSTPRVRGLDEITPFLRHVGKIVTEESQKYDTIDDLPWFHTWDSWTSDGLLTTKRMKTMYDIICPDLFYNQRTIKAVVTKCIDLIPPIKSYIEITHLSDKSVTWTSRVDDIDSFKSVRNKRTRKNNDNISKNSRHPSSSRKSNEKLSNEKSNAKSSRNSTNNPSIN